MIKSIRKVWLMFVTVFSAACGTAMAESAVGRVHAQAVVSAIFQRLDCEMEGIIETSEVDDHFAQVWLPVDLDRSRTLSPGEYSLVHRPLPDTLEEVLFQDADSDADGQVNASEFRLHLQRMIKALDVNGDREVSRQEVGLLVKAPKFGKFGFKNPVDDDL